MPNTYCGHQCTSDCRREGCHCVCGEFHLATNEEYEKLLEEDN